MIRVSEALQSIIKSNPLLEFGIHHGLFNLTQLARYLQPLVIARIQKEISISAITMSLSRLQRSLLAAIPDAQHYAIEKIAIVSGLCTATFPRSPQAHERLNRLYNEVQKNSGFCNLAEGMREITIIVENRYQTHLQNMLEQPPLYLHSRLASVGVQFGAHYADVPGMLYTLLQRVALQNVNLIEISSTYTEIVFFIAEEDTRIVFDTLFQSFVVEHNAKPGG